MSFSALNHERYLNDVPAALERSASADEYAIALAWAPPGREQEALRMLREREQVNPAGRLRHGTIVALRNYLEGLTGAVCRLPRVSAWPQRD